MRQRNPKGCQRVAGGRLAGTGTDHRLADIPAPRTLQGCQIILPRFADFPSFGWVVLAPRRGASILPRVVCRRSRPLSPATLRLLSAKPFGLSDGPNPPGAKAKIPLDKALAPVQAYLMRTAGMELDFGARFKGQCGFVFGRMNPRSASPVPLPANGPAEPASTATPSPQPLGLAPPAPKPRHHFGFGHSALSQYYCSLQL